jgi:hypothetical protein
MIGTRVAFRGAFGPHEGIVLEETEDSVILKVEKNDTLGNLGQVTIWKTSLRPRAMSLRGLQGAFSGNERGIKLTLIRTVKRGGNNAEDDQG